MAAQRGTKAGRRVRGGLRRRSPAGGRELREDRILEAAVSVLARWGFRKTTVDDVAREAGVGKGTIYLHWKDKVELFRAAIWYASQKTIEEMMKRVGADPDGGQFHRLWAHGLVAIYDNPLLSGVMTGRIDMAGGAIEALGSSTVNRLIGTSEEQIAAMQRANLIRRDVPTRVVLLLVGALKLGIISSSQLLPAGQVPTAQELTDGLSDLMRRWLEPEGGGGVSAEGKAIMKEWMKMVVSIGTRDRRTED
ncbi:MAG TPA: helix-turn-helix domain-containing protein [Spirochaetia bacterium]|nr:helix-turn-helix domain-containing protein [Spirochaetia bacterium]